MSGSRRARAGFTLVEIVVVLLILAITAAAVAPSLDGLLDRGEEPADTAEVLVGLLRDARMSAVRRAVPVTVTVAPAEGHYWVTTGGGAETLAEGTLPLEPGATLAGGGERVRFRFSAAGTASGGPIRVWAEGVAKTVAVDPWTGEPRVQRR